jgi:pimeloyl-ACP methyl ester carboxylesterase
MVAETAELVTLPDGRRLAYRVAGPVDGPPLFYFHGFPGSGAEAALLCDDHARGEWRVFSIDRPGIGFSDFARDRTLRDWAQDVSEFAKALRIERFTVLGVSGGAPYAAVCAWALPEQIRATGIVCGLGPLNDREGIAGIPALDRWSLDLLCRFPALIPATYQPLAFTLKHWPLSLLDARLHSLPARDRAVLSQEPVRETLAQSFRESVRQGAAGGAHELKVYTSPWRFAFEEIKVPVYLWHGERDTIVPSAMARGVAARIPRCRTTFFPEDGHYSILFDRKDQILETLLDQPN